jgi:hypothetical protein
MQVLFVIFSLIFGTAIGSFLNVLILRLPEGQSILGRSHCTKCGRVLGFWDLVPVLSFAFLGGKCAGCKTSISLRYPVIELLTGCLFAAGFLTKAQAKEIWDKYEKEGCEAQQQVRNEPVPTAESIWDNVFANNENADWRKF